MNNNEYRFEVNAQTSKAEAELGRLRARLVELQKTASKGTNAGDFLSQADMDKSIATSKEVKQVIKELEQAFKKVAIAQAQLGNNDSANCAINNFNSLKSSAEDAGKSINNITSNLSGLSSADNRYLKNQKVYNTELTDAEKRARNLRKAIQELRLEQNREARTERKATATGHMDYNTFSRTRKATSDESIANKIKSQGTYQQTLKNKQNEYSNNQSDLTQANKDFESGKITQTVYRERESKLKEANKALEEETKLLRELNQASKDNVKQMKKNSSMLNSGDVTTDANPNSVRGMMASRAPAIGLAVSGAALGTVASMYSSGRATERAIRPQSIKIGQQVGANDYRGYKRAISKIGMEDSTGYTPESMMNFASSVLAGQGNLGKKSTLATTKALAEATRGVPVDSDSLSEFMQSSMKNGSVSGAKQVSATTDLFAGATQVGGMEGREDEMLSALKDIADNTLAGKNSSNKDLQNLVTFQTQLSSTGDKSVQGTNGSDLISGLNSGMRSLDQSSPIGVLLGAGTKYKGLSGAWDMQKMLEKGVTQDTVGSLIQSSGMYGSKGSKQQRYGMYSMLKQLNPDVTTDQTEALMDSYDKYGSNSKQFKKAVKDAGKKTTDKNTEGYENSSEGANNSADAVKAMKKLEIADNKVTDIGTKVVKASKALPAPLWALTAAVVAATAAIVASGAGFNVANMVKKLTKSSTVDAKAGSSTVKTMVNNAKKEAGGFGSGGLGGKASSAKDSAKTFGSTIMGKAKETTLGKKAISGAETAKNSKFASKLGDIASGAKASKAGVFASGIGGKIKSGLGDVGSLFSNADTLTDLGGDAVQGASKSSSILNKIGKGASSAKSSIGSFISGATQGASKGSGLLKGLGKAGKIGGKVLGKVAVPLAIAGDALNIFTAKDKVKATGGAVGSAAGGWAGATAGASAGAAIGSIVPGVGTAIGAGVGGVVGGIAGSGIGQKLGEGAVGLGRGAVKGAKNLGKGIKSFFFGEDAQAAEVAGNGDIVSGKAKATSKKVENVAVSEKKEAEKERKSNNSKEKSNLATYKKLLAKAESILKKAKAQNGIFGNSSGSSSSGSSSSGGSGSVSAGTLKSVDEGKYWQGDGAVNSDLGYTVSGVTADSLNEWIASETGGKSSMDGLGSTFIKAGEGSGLDPRYLVAHAAVETGWGGGYSNGDADSGNWYGIGAYDNDPDNAKNYGDGIVGGAKWIADNFYNAGQTTVNEMRNNGGSHEYATDPNWDSSIASIMEDSKKYTGASTGKLSNTVNVTVNAGSSDNADTVAKKTASAVSTASTNSLNFFSKQIARI